MKIEANGISIGYDLDGPADAPVITMSHSLAANRDMWWLQTDALKQNYRVLRYDTRGHGETSVTQGPYSIALLVDDVVALLDTIGIGKTHFVGLSMGGMIGQLLAANHPGKLHSVTLCATACHMAPEMAPVWDERIKSAKDNGMVAIAGKPRLEGTDDLLETIEKVRGRANPSLSILGVLITMHDKRTSLAKDIQLQIRKVFGTKVFNTVISKNVRLEESPAYRESIFSFAPDSKGATDYYSLCEEVMDRV